MRLTGVSTWVEGPIKESCWFFTPQHAVLIWALNFMMAWILFKFLVDQHSMKITAAATGGCIVMMSKSIMEVKNKVV
jgi:hypothetical protein